MELISFNGRNFHQLRDQNGDFSIKVVAPASDPSNRIGFEIQVWRGTDTSPAGTMLGVLTTKDVLATDSGTTWNFHSGEKAKAMWELAVCQYFH